MIMKKLLFFTTFFTLLLLQRVSLVKAFDTSKLGVHILNIYELEDAKSLVSNNSNSDFSSNEKNILGVSSESNEEDLASHEDWSYVTIPITLDDLTTNKGKDWQIFFNNARELKIIPIVRLTTKFSPEKNAWIVPNKKQIIDQLDFLSKLDWPTEKKHIIVYNEVNHAAEWGGRVDPEGYSRVLKFVSSWAHTEEKNYVVLPAAMDLAAPNGRSTLEAFNYLSQMYNLDSEIFSYIDVWNSHSYPNPGFVSTPTKIGKNSLRGFQYELDFLKSKTGNDYKVMITETGWKDTSITSKWLSSYYVYAMQHIWSDDRVLAVTPFLLKGAPGPFAGFSFFDAENKPTELFHSFRTALEIVSEES